MAVRFTVSGLGMLNAFLWGIVERLDDWSQLFGGAWLQAYYNDVLQHFADEGETAPKWKKLSPDYEDWKAYVTGSSFLPMGFFSGDLISAVGDLSAFTSTVGRRQMLISLSGTPEHAGFFDARRRILLRSRDLDHDKYRRIAEAWVYRQGTPEELAGIEQSKRANAGIFFSGKKLGISVPGTRRQFTKHRGNPFRPTTASEQSQVSKLLKRAGTFEQMGRSFAVKKMQGMLQVKKAKMAAGSMMPSKHFVGGVGPRLIKKPRG